MKRYHVIFLFLMTLAIMSLSGTAALRAGDKNEKKQNILTQEQAAVLASKIANEKFKKSFGISPFSPESYKAELVDNKWHWGKINPAGINGCSAVVTFDKYGFNETVKVVFCSDQLRTFDIQKKSIDIQKKSIEIDDAIKVMPDKVKPGTETPEAR